MYSPSMTIVNEPRPTGYNYYSYTKEKTLEVVKIPVAPTQEETTSEDAPITKNPKTSDNIINYVLITILCMTSLIIIKKTQ
jgi:hypothetical protein